MNMTQSQLPDIWEDALRCRHVFGVHLVMSLSVPCSECQARSCKNISFSVRSLARPSRARGGGRSRPMMYQAVSCNSPTHATAQFITDCGDNVLERWIGNCSVDGGDEWVGNADKRQDEWWECQWVWGSEFGALSIIYAALIDFYLCSLVQEARGCHSPVSVAAPRAIGTGWNNRRASNKVGSD
jgi:hypothetical protein